MRCPCQFLHLSVDWERLVVSHLNEVFNLMGLTLTPGSSLTFSKLMQGSCGSDILHWGSSDKEFFEILPDLVCLLICSYPQPPDTDYLAKICPRWSSLMSGYGFSAPWLIAAVGLGVVGTGLVCGVMGVNWRGHSSHVHRVVGWVTTFCFFWSLQKLPHMWVFHHNGRGIGYSFQLAITATL